jgi:ribosome assembly protein 1
LLHRYLLKTNYSNPEKVTKIVTALSLTVAPRDLKSKDAKHLLSVIFSQWLSLSTCIIQSVIEVVPPPTVSQRTRIPKMIHPDLREDTIPPKTKLEEDMWAAKADKGAYVTAYVSKMFAVPVKDLPENKKRPLTADEMRARAKEARAAREAEQASQDGAVPDERLVPTGQQPPPTVHQTPDQEDASKEEAETQDAEVLLGFARLYSGTIKVGASVYALLPKYNGNLEPTSPYNSKYLVKAEVEGLYIMMGRDLVAVDSVQAGNIFAIKGLEGKVWRSATLCSVGPSEEDDVAAHKAAFINLGAVSRSVSCFFFCDTRTRR